LEIENQSPTLFFLSLCPSWQNDCVSEMIAETKHYVMEIELKSLEAEGIGSINCLNVKRNQK